jgi:type III pantothenate kinase
MQSGVFWGYIALIEGWSRGSSRLGQAMTVIGTGGVASLFTARRRLDHFDPDLTIRGMLRSAAGTAKESHG